MKSKNTILQALSVLLALTLVLSACATSKETTTTGTKQSAAGNAEGTIVQGGELSYALATSPDTLDHIVVDWL